MTATDARAAAFREAVLAILEPLPRETPLLLSGGTDSATVLAGLLALGRSPACYTFRLGAYESPDVRVARMMAETFGLRHTIVTIPRNDETLIADVRRILAITRNPRKTHVQCGHPFLYLAPAIIADGHQTALTGLGADDLYGTTRQLAIACRRSDDAACSQARRAHASRPTASDYSIVAVCQHFGLRLVPIFRDPRLRELILATPYRELHRPTQKGIALRAFPEFWRRGAWYRRNMNLQVASGLREWHDTLLRSPVNRRGARTVAALYRDLLSETHDGAYGDRKGTEATNPEQAALSGAVDG